jgi:hypothetical protein
MTEVNIADFKRLVKAALREPNHFDSSDADKAELEMYGLMVEFIQGYVRGVEDAAEINPVTYHEERIKTQLDRAYWHGVQVGIYRMKEAIRDRVATLKEI